MDRPSRPVPCDGVVESWTCKRHGHEKHHSVPIEYPCVLRAEPRGASKNLLLEISKLNRTHKPSSSLQGKAARSFDSADISSARSEASRHLTFVSSQISSAKTVAIKSSSALVSTASATTEPSSPNSTKSDLRRSAARPTRFTLQVTCFKAARSLQDPIAMLSLCLQLSQDPHELCSSFLQTCTSTLLQINAFLPNSARPTDADSC